MLRKTLLLLSDIKKKKKKKLLSIKNLNNFSQWHTLNGSHARIWKWVIILDDDEHHMAHTRLARAEYILHHRETKAWRKYNGVRKLDLY